MTGGPDRIERKLAAIFAADVAGYSRLMEQDEVRTLRTLIVHREVMDRLIAEHGGRIANTAGDSVLAEFSSAVEAVQCAVDVQKALNVLSSNEDTERAFRFRIGVHLGDVMVKGGDLLGDGVNVTARLQALAPPGGVCISGDIHRQVRKALPLTYTNLGLQQVKNIEEAVQAFIVDAAQGEAALQGRREHAQSKPLTVPKKPSIAVLPFINLSSDPEQEYFADGVVEDIITALSRIRWLFVIARNSTFTYKGKTVDLRHIGQELGVRYVLEGSVRRASRRVRLTGQLLEAETGRHIWTDRFDEDLDDIFELQDRIAASVVGAIEPQLVLAETERAQAKPTESLAAYDLYLRAWAQVRALTQAGSTAALRLLEQTTELDPQYASAIGLQSSVYGTRVNHSWADDVDKERIEGSRLAHAAIECGGNDPTALSLAALPLSYLGREHHEALSAVERSLSLNPNGAAAWNAAGYIRLNLGRVDEAAESFRRAIRLSPIDPELYRTRCGLALAHLLAKRFDEAIEEGTRALSVNPAYPTTKRVLASAYANLGKLDEAKRLVQRILAVEPGLTLTVLRHRSPAFGPAGEHYFSGLLRAGLLE